MEALIKKWGNSLGIRIPKRILDMLNLSEYKKVEIKVVGGNIVILPKKSLDELLSKIEEKNRHKEIDFGKPQGKELW